MHEDRRRALIFAENNKLLIKYIDQQIRIKLKEKHRKLHILFLSVVPAVDLDIIYYDIDFTIIIPKSKKGGIYTSYTVLSQIHNLDVDISIVVERIYGGMRRIIKIRE